MITSRDGRVGVGKVREFRIDMYTLLCLNLKTNSVFCIAQKTLLIKQPKWENNLKLFSNSVYKQ